MILIFGGAYQGKLNYAKANFNVDTIWDCSAGAVPNFEADCICGIEGYVMECAKSGEDPRKCFEENRDLWQNSVLVVTDTSQGVVPIDRTVREFREMNGRLLLWLAGEADRVIRVFCGIGKDMK
ncbi:MAG: bifunctional adenosylcobinamide kinase/adenosylcobinamide-phosphate guanylyltransferase [Firmicutes bacterium]|nr:bifunctional adenosylcobinamide kinase/adenosylcobinamide-phosphate guanylyltransferase [Bacillota bacterium]MDY6173726.1 bifunctional adenosylcobinamide kinase/adenosylcobinamide-phosphate guanylyltransferase [Lentihominibacter sp.]